MIDEIVDFLRHPLSQTASILGGLWALLHPSAIDAALAVVWSQSGSIFGLASLLGFSLGPRLAWVPADIWTYIAIGAGLLLVAKRGLGLYRSYTNELRDSRR